MEMISPTKIGKAVYEGIREAATTLRADYFAALHDAWAAADGRDPNGIDTHVLHSIIENSFYAAREGLPICQDTGSAWICLEVGEELSIPGNIFSEVDNAVARAYEEGRLRMSLVRDGLFDRTNTHNNTPAFCDLKLVPGRGCRLHIMLKGGGSDNASRLIMLPPSGGKEAIIEEVLSCVREKAANACPPLVIGVGVGTTFDKVASLSKMALLRKIGTPAESAEAAAFEKELLEAVNTTGIGPAALGGSPVALAVHLKTAPCHIAALPLAINLGCCALRSVTMEIVNADGVLLKDPAADSWEPTSRQDEEVLP